MYVDWHGMSEVLFMIWLGACSNQIPSASSVYPHCGCSCSLTCGEVGHIFMECPSCSFSSVSLLMFLAPEGGPEDNVPSASREAARAAATCWLLLTFMRSTTPYRLLSMKGMVLRMTEVTFRYIDKRFHMISR